MNIVSIKGGDVLLKHCSMRNYNGKLVYITGGSSGIGFAIASEFLKAGASVLLIARNVEKLQSAQEKLVNSLAAGDVSRVSVCSVDISKFDDVSSALREKLETVGIPDILVNGAGISYPNYFDQIPHEIFVKTIEINLIGTWNVISTVVPAMKARGGHLVNISSMAGYVGTFGYAAYSASKFGIIGYSQVLKGELKPYGIRVSILCPPDTDTPQLIEEDQTKPPETRAISGNVKVMKPEKVAKILLKDILKGKFMILPGGMNKITYVLTRLFPGFVFMMMDSDIKKVQKKLRSKNEQ